jgi:hypothetical protein
MVSLIGRMVFLSVVRFSQLALYILEREKSFCEAN